MKFPLDKFLLDKILVDIDAVQLDQVAIRHLFALVNNLEKVSAEKYVRMEIGSPGFEPCSVGVEGEIEALKNGVASIYPPIDGIAEVKIESSKFIKNFIGIDVDSAGCIPTTGSMQGVFTSMITTMQRDEKDTILFLDPGFLVQKQQAVVLGYKYLSFDIYEHRGDKLEAKLKEYLDENKISSLVYNNPNNPTWMCLTNSELEIIGRLATQYDFVVLEDLAYLCMDFRSDLSKPGEGPFQATVARYTDNYIVHISCSKVFSYAGQRGAVSVISNKLYNRRFDAFKKRYSSNVFGVTYINSILYSLSAGVTHSVQFGMAAMFRAANEGRLNFVEQMREYGRRATIVKDIFKRNGFTIPYTKDGQEDIADGFFFTITYGDMRGDELLYELLRYGVSAITLKSTGGTKHGLRACTSIIKDEQFAQLEERLSKFNMSKK